MVRLHTAGEVWYPRLPCFRLHFAYCLLCWEISWVMWWNVHVEDGYWSERKRRVDPSKISDWMHLKERPSWSPNSGKTQWGFTVCSTPRRLGCKVYLMTHPKNLTPVFCPSFIELRKGQRSVTSMPNGDWHSCIWWWSTEPRSCFDVTFYSCSVTPCESGIRTVHCMSKTPTLTSMSVLLIVGPKCTLAA